MAEVEIPAVAPAPQHVNVADQLAEHARRAPDQIAVVCRQRNSNRDATITFAELDADATRIALGLIDWGVTPGTRLALLVRPGVDFVALVFALLRAGVVMVLVDPGLGRKNLVRCLADTDPEGFVAIPIAQAARLWHHRKFPHSKWNVTVGRRWFWGGMTLEAVRQRGDGTRSVPATLADDPAAIIFTSGSTGPPKGVLYTHGMFDTQVAEIQSQYNLEPGGVDLSCFPLFALFNSAMGVTTVLPDMDFSRPAAADPNKLLAVANRWKITQAFASPALWRNLGNYCAKTGARIDSLRQIFSCGAPVPADILKSTLALAAPDAKMHTPYGATECLPVATIEAAEVLHETAARTDAGAGVCVGRKFDSIEWRVIRITDKPIANIDDAEPLPTGEIGELIVCGPQVSPSYVTRPKCNAPAKINDKRAGASSPPSVWHRMGDVGYLDELGRFWYCGRKSHCVVTGSQPLYTECIEGVINSHPRVSRSALVGAKLDGKVTPIVWIEMAREYRTVLDFTRIIAELRHESPYREATVPISMFMRCDNLPVDIRHNAKIRREELASDAEASIASSFVD
jgi:acyl-CoA synthetase (AMP-forming)/AMP-acid ligase II